MAARKAREPDPPSRLATLKTELEGGALAPGYVLRGEESYFQDQALGLLRARAEEDAYELCAHDALDPDFELGRLLNDLGGASLFSAARFVVVRHADKLLKKEGDKQSALTRAVVAFVAEEGAGTVVLSAQSVRADHAASKAVVKAGGAVIGCRRLWDSPPPWNPDPRRAELVQWLVARSRALGFPLDPGQAAFVCAATGNDLYALENQIERLRLSGQDSLRETIGWEASGSPFQLAEDLSRGDAARSLHGAEALFRGGFTERSGARLVDENGLVAILFGSLNQKLRQGLAGALAVEEGEDPVAAVERAGFNLRPTEREAFAQKARSRPSRTWRAMIEELAALDRRSKTGGKVDCHDVQRLALAWRLEPRGPRGGSAGASRSRGGRPAARSRPRS